jgi:hypothetical protein
VAAATAAKGKATAREFAALATPAASRPWPKRPPGLAVPALVGLLSDVLLLLLPSAVRLLTAKPRAALQLATLPGWPPELPAVRSGCALLLAPLPLVMQALAGLLAALQLLLLPAAEQLLMARPRAALQLQLAVLLLAARLLKAMLLAARLQAQLLAPLLLIAAGQLAALLLTAPLLATLPGWLPLLPAVRSGCALLLALSLLEVLVLVRLLPAVLLLLLLLLPAALLLAAQLLAAVLLAALLLAAMLLKALLAAMLLAALLAAVLLAAQLLAAMLLAVLLLAALLLLLAALLTMTIRLTWVAKKAPAKSRLQVGALPPYLCRLSPCRATWEDLATATPEMPRPQLSTWPPNLARPAADSSRCCGRPSRPFL